MKSAVVVATVRARTDGAHRALDGIGPGRTVWGASGGMKYER
jgi:hypothetical protein